MKKSKQHLIKQTSLNLEMTYSLCTEVIQEFIDQLINDIKNGDTIEIRGLGTFSTTKTKERTRINPRTKEKFTQGPQSVVKFKVSSIIKEDIND